MLWRNQAIADLLACLVHVSFHHREGLVLSTVTVSSIFPRDMVPKSDRGPSTTTMAKSARFCTA